MKALATENQLPPGWHQPRINDIAARRANATVGGPFGSDLVAKDYVDSGVPVIRGQNMGQRHVAGDFAFVSPAKAKALQANLARPSDLVFTQRGTLGQVALVPADPYEEYLISQSQMKLTLDMGVAAPGYVLQYFASALGQKQILDSAIQTGVPHTNLGILRNYAVPMPRRLDEQEAIAAALTDADALIDSLEQLLTKKRQIKQGAMQELLTGKRRLPGFEGAWRRATVRDLELSGALTLSRGKVISKKSIADKPGLYPIYSSSIHNNGLFGCYGDFMFDEELITWSVDGGGNFFYRPKHKFSVTNVCGYMRVRAPLNCRFIAFQLEQQHSSKMFDYQTKAHPSVVRAEYLIALPEEREQVAIAQILSDMDTEVTALESRLTKARALKQAMAQALLTGRIRLVEPTA